MRRLPRMALTLGDVAGVGPETVVRAVAEETTLTGERRYQPLIVGHPDIVGRAMKLIDRTFPVQVVDTPSAAAEDPRNVLCWNPSSADAPAVEPASIDARAGQAAYDWLVASTHAALKSEVDAIVTAPLNKFALHAAGISFPGHTEILAHECGVSDFAMMLYLPPGAPLPGGHSLSVGHVTLHTSIASVPGLLTTDRIREKIELVHGFLKMLGTTSPRIGVCALNPHAGEDGLFGDEELRLIAPAVSDARRRAVQAGNTTLEITGPLPADTLLKRAVEGEFDGVVAMYHDQGHIALKLIGFHRAVNVTLGLPIIRTSPSQGTAFDIAWKGMADPSGFQAAIETALLLVRARNTP